MPGWQAEVYRGEFHKIVRSLGGFDIGKIDDFLK
jgi:hypothetical protein